MPLEETVLPLTNVVPLPVLKPLLLLIKTPPDPDEVEVVPVGENTAPKMFPMPPDPKLNYSMW